MEREFSLFETSWPQLAEVALSAALAYAAIVVIIRVSGARTTAQLNSFDWIVNVIVGSLAASGILLEDVSLLASLTGIIVLVALQYTLARLTQHFKPFEKLVKDEPVMLTHKGRYLREAMRRTRISEDEIMTALRGEGHTSVEDANWVILETNGTLSVIPRDENKSLETVEALERVAKPGLRDALS
ncbi:DUF421 domain-containing protein [Alteraurantiacibacter aquimixticola]|uniref:DUF421 domain-containing protein n=1 Tax=Alteraurantiacibacter aquimixticola TaxID=2489173 RepID=A0A4T3EYS1_9SPHN|nr:YetF domain-containing protein [Alteraurantiacibacter aquimixticola]TIX49796.1 DUF421 domain-containing protein [Alteraurantiacibacter aquimixticola]